MSRLNDSDAQALARWALGLMAVPDQADEATRHDYGEVRARERNALMAGMLRTELDLCPLDADQLRAVTGEIAAGDPPAVPTITRLVPDSR